MAYDNDPSMDEDGEPLMDPDAESDRENSPEPLFDDDVGDEEEEDWRRERSPTPAYDEDKVGKPRKRLVKKSGEEGSDGIGGGGEGLEDWEDRDEEEEEAAASAEKSKKKKRKVSEEGGGKDRRKSGTSSSKGSKSALAGLKGYDTGGSKDDAGGSGDPEMQELWDTIAGGDSEDDQEGARTVDDDAFIDDAGVDPVDQFGSDNEGSIGRHPQAEEGEEDDEASKLFKGGKKKKNNEKSPAELALIVEHLMAELEVTAEEDAELNRQSKPAINKLKKLPLLTEVLAKKKLQQEFLDHGVLTLLKNWLEPLPDGSFPNMNIRTAILQILADFPIDLEQYDRREQLKKSGLGKVIMFLSKSDEETTSNRKLAKELVDKWSRPIFNKSTRFEDMRRYDDERIPYRRPPSKKPMTKSDGLDSRDDDLDEFSQGPKSGHGASRQHASRPEALPLDFAIRPQSKVDPEQIRARARQCAPDQRRLKMNKKLQQLKAPKKKSLQASRISVEGRGMVKYL
ncbi:protein IWS1-like protein 1-like [Iris pallida]|uniref:Protein IWS1-like protein 1-like n=1 Tax=Iris pallida TaxID=29817 RepID=A0AAX6GDV0_IRIPA|nr:protein IWS1-like protein 1-like [Iris pallida]KAJ6829598.1 protein IWS1-like protein 1-like [Iris pallida]